MISPKKSKSKICIVILFYYYLFLLDDKSKCPSTKFYNRRAILLPKPRHIFKQLSPNPIRSNNTIDTQFYPTTQLTHNFTQQHTFSHINIQKKT